MAQTLRHVLDLSNTDWVRLERIADRFEEAWRRGERPAIDAYLPPPEAADDRRSVLIELVHAEIEFRLGHDEPARVEEYLRRYPVLAQDRAVVWELIAAESEPPTAPGPGPPARRVPRPVPRVRPRAGGALAGHGRRRRPAPPPAAGPGRRAGARPSTSWGRSRRSSGPRPGRSWASSTCSRSSAAAPSASSIAPGIPSCTGSWP